MGKGAETMVELPCPASRGTLYRENGFPQPSLQTHHEVSRHDQCVMSLRGETTGEDSAGRSGQHAAGRTVAQFDNYY